MKTKRLYFLPPHRCLWALCPFLAAIILWLTARLLPASAEDMRASACTVSGVSHLCVVTGTDTLVVWTDTVCAEGIWIERQWWWPSCEGRVLTVLQGHPYVDSGAWLTTDSLPALITAQTDSLGVLLKRKAIERKELLYYLRCHGVQDEGYQRIAQYAERQAAEQDSLQKIYNVLQKTVNRQKPRLVRTGQYTVAWRDSHGVLCRAACEPVVCSVGRLGKPLVLQTVSHRKPTSAYAVRHLPWMRCATQQIITVKTLNADSAAPPLLVPGSSTDSHHHNLPHLLAAEGSPVFSNRGWFVGIVTADSVTSQYEYATDNKK